MDVNIWGGANSQLALVAQRFAQFQGWTSPIWFEADSQVPSQQIVLLLTDRNELSQTVKTDRDHQIDLVTGKRVEIQRITEKRYGWITQLSQSLDLVRPDTSIISH